jgi:hypothetical protein
VPSAEWAAPDLATILTGRTAFVRTLIALLAGVLLAVAAVTVLVHDETASRPAPARVLFSYGSG